MTTNLPELRNQIDALDRELLKLLNQRARVAEEVGELKRREGSPFFRPDRVAAVIEKIQQANTGPLKNEHVTAIWREIMSACLALETPMRVAYLGPAGTFSEQAALQFFGASIEHVACSSIDEVFRATASGSAGYGVVPVENSTEGVVSRSLDLFLNSPLHIVGETSLMVRHNLLRLSDSLEGERAGVQFGLHNAAHAIQDDAFNRTRFAVVCLPQTLSSPPASGKDCISLIVSVPNRPGAVHDILGPLKTHGVSMTRFESRPARSGQWEYYFYIDLQGHTSQPHVSAALTELQQLCAFFKVLGTYPAGD
jgi:chorismate mutase/prephenate dehydratase